MIIDYLLLVAICWGGWIGIKLVCYLLYIWQNYEYRIDRLAVYFRSKRFGYDLNGVFSGAELLTVRRPRLTIKTGLLAIATFDAALIIFGRTMKPLSASLQINHNLWLSIWVTLCLVIVVIPFVNLTLMMLINLPAAMIKWAVIRAAGRKLARQRSLMVIGITGSYGKSTTKEILAWLLQSRYRVVKTEGTVNTEIGIARQILRRVNEQTEILVVEMGAYRRGEIARIGRLVKPKIGVITGINEQHLALFGSLKQTLAAKYELIRALPPDGLAVFNLSSPPVSILYRRTSKVRKIGYRRPAVRYQTNITAGYLQENIAGAVTVARYLQVPEKQITAALTTVPPSRYFIQIRKGVNHSIVYDSSYNTNPDGYVSALTLVGTRRPQKTIVVTPGIIELGPAEEKIHRRLARLTGRTARLVVLTNPNFREIFAAYLPASARLLVAGRRTDWQRLVPPRARILLIGRIPGWLYRRIIKE